MEDFSPETSDDLMDANVVELQKRVLDLNRFTRANDRIIFALSVDHDSTPIEQDHADEHELRERLRVLETQMLSTSATRVYRENAIRSCSFGNTMFETLTSQSRKQDKGEADYEFSNDKLKHDNLEALLQQLTTASENHLKKDEEIEKTKAKLVRRQKRCLELIVKARKLCQETKTAERYIEEKKLDKNTANIARLKTELKNLENMEALLKCLIQEVVVFSRQNWCDNKKVVNVLTKN